MSVQKFEKMITPALSNLGFNCVRIQFSGGGSQAGRAALQIMAEPCEDRDMTVEAVSYTHLTLPTIYSV